MSVTESIDPNVYPIADDAEVDQPVPESIPIEEITGIAEIAGAKFEWTYTTPLHEKDIADPRRLIMANGWWGVDDTLRALGAEVAQRGKAALRYNPARSRGWLRDLNPLNYRRSQVAKLNSMMAWGAMRAVNEELGTEQYDGYGQSMGGQTITNLALAKPEHMGTVILDASCGVDLHGLTESVWRSVVFVNYEFLPARRQLARQLGPGVLKKTIYYGLRNPLLTLVEGLDAGAANLQPKLSLLADKHDIGRVALQSQRDAFSPAAKVKRDSGHLFVPFLIRDDPESGHTAAQLDPAGTADLIMIGLAVNRNSHLKLVT